MTVGGGGKSFKVRYIEPRVADGLNVEGFGVFVHQGLEVGRIVTIPYYPLSDDMIGKIIELQLGRITRRILENHKVPFTYDESLVKLIAGRCTELESGGRMIDAILTNTMLPAISSEFLGRMISGEPIEKVHVSVSDGDFAYSFA